MIVRCIDRQLIKSLLLRIWRRIGAAELMVDIDELFMQLLHLHDTTKSITLNDFVKNTIL